MVQNLEKNPATDKKTSQAPAKDSKQSSQSATPTTNKSSKNTTPRMDPSGLPKLR